MAHSPALTTRTATAARMRAIGARRPLPAHGRDFVCARCDACWTGAERDCFHCGLPATAEYTHPGMALQVLLHTVGRPATLPQHATAACTEQESLR
ncbi:hypothetical protein ABR738_01330 [Streptomyces sp. Edi4]|uniref:hypothetical protein n=1 Tax=Streptomyces sp. Edi4 TaxID=3162527 RepID=UPI00330672FF